MFAPTADTSGCFSNTLNKCSTVPGNTSTSLSRNNTVLSCDPIERKRPASRVTEIFVQWNQLNEIRLLNGVSELRLRLMSGRIVNQKQFEGNGNVFLQRCDLRSKFGPIGHATASQP